MSKDESHTISPIHYTGDPSLARDRLLEIVKSLPRTEILTQEERYIHTTFTSLIFRFVDDVEFIIDDEKKLIQVRSASRVGHSDFGINRKRIEQIRALYTKK